MSTEYTGAATWHPTVTLPSDGDQRNATSINAANEDLADNCAWLKQFTWPSGESGLEAYNGGDVWWSSLNLPPPADPRYGSTLHASLRRLADRTQYLKNPLNIEWPAGAYPKVSARTLQRPTRAPFYSSVWTPSFHGKSWYCPDTTAAKTWCKEYIEKGCSVESVAVWLVAMPHGAWPVQYMPVLAVYALDVQDQGTTLLGTTTDDSTQETYETDHDVVVSCAAHTWADTEVLFIQVTNENGTNAVSGLALNGAIVSVNATEIHPF
jgi:hypothetical protein